MLTTLAIGLTGNLELLAGGLIAVVMLFAVIRKLTIPKRVKDQAESDNISDAEMLAPIRKAEHRGLGFGEKEEKVWTNDSDVEIKVANGEVTSIRRNPNKNPDGSFRKGGRVFRSESPRSPDSRQRKDRS